MRFLSPLFIVSIFCFFISGCGYTASSLLPAELDSIHVDNFTNKIDPTREVSDKRASYSYRPGVENEITKAIIDRFILDRHLDVDTEENAALLLKGALVDFRQYPISYSDDYEVEEYRIEVYADVELYNNRTGELMWKKEYFRGKTDYDVTGSDSKTESQALDEATDDLAENIVERTIESW